MAYLSKSDGQTLAKDKGITHDRGNFVAGLFCGNRKVCKLALGQLTGVRWLDKSLIKMIFLSTFNKGGVGKTTLAVHLAKRLAERGEGRILLVDCVDQFNAYRFFTRSAPQETLTPKQITDRLSVLWNDELKRLTSFVDVSEYDHYVIDLNSPREDTVRAMVGSDPDIILVPINDQALALDQLAETLGMIAAMQTRSGFYSKVLIVPLGEKKTNITQKLQSISQEQTLPAKLRMTKRINQHPTEFRESLRNGMPVWQFPGCEYVGTVFDEIIDT